MCFPSRILLGTGLIVCSKNCIRLQICWYFYTNNSLNYLKGFLVLPLDKCVPLRVYTISLQTRYHRGKTILLGIITMKCPNANIKLIFNSGESFEKKVSIC